LARAGLRNFWIVPALATLGAGEFARADDGDAAVPKRPTIEANRWAEDWSVLADPRLRTEPFDGLKYIPLWASDPKSFVSLGATLRERFETNDAVAFGTGNTPADSYLIQRLQVHADIHFNENWRTFIQLEDDQAFDKLNISPVDQDRIDLRLAFLEYVNTFSAGTLKARIGRQDFAFDLQRFVSSRDGPNVRQSFDAVWADWETGVWRFIGFVSRPVQYSDVRPFDDTSNDNFRFSTLNGRCSATKSCPATIRSTNATAPNTWMPLAMSTGTSSTSASRATRSRSIGTWKPWGRRVRWAPRTFVPGP
jgi:hypothetical protein